MNAIYKFVMAQLAKSSAKKTGIATIQSGKSLSVELNVKQIEQTLKNMGVDISKITSPKEVEKLLDIQASWLKQTPKKSKPPADVHDLSGKKIDTSKPILGGKNVPETESQIKTKLEGMNEKTIERIRRRRYEAALKAEREKMAKDPDYLPKILDPEDFAYGGIAGMLGERTPMKKGNRALTNVQNEFLKMQLANNPEYIAKYFPNVVTEGPSGPLYDVDYQHGKPGNVFYEGGAEFRDVNVPYDTEGSRINIKATPEQAYGYRLIRTGMKQPGSGYPTRRGFPQRDPDYTDYAYMDPRELFYKGKPITGGQTQAINMAPWILESYGTDPSSPRNEMVPTPEWWHKAGKDFGFETRDTVDQATLNDFIESVLVHETGHGIADKKLYAKNTKEATTLDFAKFLTPNQKQGHRYKNFRVEEHDQEELFNRMKDIERLKIMFPDSYEKHPLWKLYQNRAEMQFAKLTGQKKILKKGFDDYKKKIKPLVNEYFEKVEKIGSGIAGINIEKEEIGMPENLTRVETPYVSRARPHEAQGGRIGLAGGGVAGLLGEPTYADDNHRVPYKDAKLVKGETYFPPKNYYSLGLGSRLNEFMSEGRADEEGFHTTLNKNDLINLWNYLEENQDVDLKKDLMFRFGRDNPEEKSQFHFELGKDKAGIGYKKQIDFNRWLMRKADGGRIGFKLGGIDKMRRLFLQAMGAGVAGAGAAKSGLFGLLKGSKSAVVKDLTSVPIKSGADGMPLWFKPLVNKVIKEGDNVTKKFATAEREIVHKTKLPDSQTDVIVTQNLDSGDVVVDIGLTKHGFPDGHLGQPVRLEYKAAEVIEPENMLKAEGRWSDGKPTGPGKKTKEEFWVEEAEFTGGHPENIKFEESTIEKFGDHGSNFDEVEMFATGKVKKVKPTKKAEKTEFESGKAEADADRWADDLDMASGGRVPLKKGKVPKGPNEWLEILDIDWDDMDPDEWVGILRSLGVKGHATGGRVPLGKGKLVKGLGELAQKLAKEKARTKRISGNLRFENQKRTNIGKPKLSEDEYNYYRELLDDEENYFVMGDETKEMLEAMVKEADAEMNYMHRLYKKGALDPTPGEQTRGRLKMLEDKAQSGVVMTTEEIKELKILSDMRDRLALGGRVPRSGGLAGMLGE